MRNPNTRYAFVGFFVLAMLTVTVVALASLAGRGQSSETYHVEFANVAGLKFGTQVRFEGFPIGQVERIAPDTDTGRFRVALAIREGWPVPADSIAAIGSSGLLTGKTVDIAAGASDDVLAPGATIASIPTTDMFTVMSQVAGEFSTLNRDGLLPLVDRVSGLVEDVGITLQRDLSALITALNASAGDLQRASPEIMRDVTALTTSLNQSAAALNQVLTPETMDAARQAVFNAELATLNLASLSSDLSLAADQAANAMAAVDAVVNDGAPTIGDSLTDVRYAMQSLTDNLDNILHNLDGTARNMNEFSRLIRRNPGVLLNPSPPEEVSPAAAALPQ